mmetsp:Transcript_10964/g.31778  ORF Transcript_10964/g.31778 Transcript_10964/m.31778 type:complete len:242 (+) Transcript_10964:1021-1746(+)
MSCTARPFLGGRESSHLLLLPCRVLTEGTAGRPAAGGREGWEGAGVASSMDCDGGGGGGGGSAPLSVDAAAGALSRHFSAIRSQMLPWRRLAHSWTDADTRGGAQRYLNRAVDASCKHRVTSSDPSPPPSSAFRSAALSPPPLDAPFIDPFGCDSDGGWRSAGLSEQVTDAAVATLGEDMWSPCFDSRPWRGSDRLNSLHRSLSSCASGHSRSLCASLSTHADVMCSIEESLTSGKEGSVR